MLGRIGGRLERRGPSTVNDLYNLARFRALLHSLRDSNRTHPESGESRGLHSIDLDHALECLRRAVEAGWSDADRAEREPDLAPLHDREDFCRLIAALRDRAFPANVFAP